MSEDFADRLRTVDSRGKRLWVHAEIFAPGAWRKRRRAVAWFLFGAYLAIPWIPVGGAPLLLFDWVSKRLHFFGQELWFHEVSILGPLVLSCIFLVFAATAWAGRAWCGWACPQTVYLEFLYRPIEEWIEGHHLARRRLDAAPWDWRKFRIKATKWAAYSVVSLGVANTFIAYFTGGPKLWAMILGGPAASPGFFGTMTFVFVAMMWNFGWFREQLCTIACPYGRLQSVLLDPGSLIVGYQAQRGEPRGRAPAVAEGPASLRGDCVDCSRCVRVCPTGIDIRDGLQMECIQCLACVDVCNEVMSRVRREPDLIRLTTLRRMRGETGSSVRLRPWIYVALAAFFGGIVVHGLATRSEFDVVAMRGTLADTVVEGDSVRNHLSILFENKTGLDQRLSIRPVESDYVLLAPQDGGRAAAQDKLRLEVFVILPKTAFQGGVAHRSVRISAGRSEKILKLSLLGPER